MLGNQVNMEHSTRGVRQPFGVTEAARQPTCAREPSRDCICNWARRPSLGGSMQVRAGEAVWCSYVAPIKAAQPSPSALGT